jgi:putative membrane protein
MMTPKISNNEHELSLGGLEIENLAAPFVVARSALGGVLMGLANLVPGISGGTMLLAAGVYPAFISAIAELTTLRFRPRSLLLLGTIAATAALAILLLAGLMRDLVIHQRWVMYSLFIGLTLGGVPLVWRLARPASPGLVIAAVAAFVLMGVMQFGLGGQAAGGPANIPLLFVSGLAGASAMILPGVSGGYLLLLLGQYEMILGALDSLKRGLLGGPDVSLVLEAMVVMIPVGLGVVAGIVGVSNLLKWLLERFEKPTLGALLGLLFGAVVGLWPFQQTVEPALGDLIEGVTVTAENLQQLDFKHWEVEHFRPGVSTALGSLGLMAVGFLATVLISRVGQPPGNGADS